MPNTLSQLESLVRQSLEIYKQSWKKSEDAHAAGAPPDSPSYSKMLAVERDVRHNINLERCASALEKIATLLEGKT